MGNQQNKQKNLPIDEYGLTPATDSELIWGADPFSYVVYPTDPMPCKIAKAQWNAASNNIYGESGYIGNGYGLAIQKFQAGNNLKRAMKDIKKTCKKKPIIKKN